MPSKYGGVPVEETPVSKYGGVPIDYDAIANKQPSAASRFASGALEQLNPVTAVQGAAQAVAHPIDTLDAMESNREGLVTKAIDAFEKGDYITSARHALMSLVPAMGPAIDKMGDQAQSGDVAGSLGGVAGLGVQVAGPALLPKSARVTPKLGTNPKVVAAAGRALEEGVPVNLSAVTDNRFIRGAQEMSGSTVGGAIPEMLGNAAEKAGYVKWAERLGDQAKPTVKVNTAYADWDAGLRNPANVRTVTIKPAVQTAYGPPIPAVTENIALPVDVRLLKGQAKSWLKSREAWPLAKKQSDPAYALNETIANSSGFIPAESAEIGLSGIKSQLRKIGTEFSADTSKNVMRGQAGSVAERLQQQIDRSVGAVDPAALRSLRAGRKAAAEQAGADYLGEIFADAQAQGSWSGAQGMWRKWQNLDAAEKRTMFSPALASDLDKLFLAAKRSEMVGSGSRTAPLVSSAGSVTGAVTGASMGHPVLAALSVAGPAIFSTLAHNPTFVKAAIRGLSFPAKSTAATGAAAKIISMAGVDQGIRVVPTALPLAAENNVPAGEVQND